MDTRPEAVALMQLAKAQAGEIDLLLQGSSLADDAGYYKEMQAASHSIVDCLLEGFNKDRPEQFQKNFLVIAKVINTELQKLLLSCFTEKHLAQKKYEQLSQTNASLGAGLVSAIQQWQSNNSTTATSIETKS